MVYFTCNHCGDSLKKISVEKHYFGPCRRQAKFVTCVDCIKDFRGEEYNDHTKCITENEKYSAKGFTSRAPSVKGEVKQLSWLELIQYVSVNSKNIPTEQSALLKKLSAHSNVPQKRARFHNFVKNVSHHTHTAVVDHVWDLLEAEKSARKEKEEKIDKKPIHENGNSNGSVDKAENGVTKKQSMSSDGTELDSKKKKKKQKGKCDETNGDVIVNRPTDDEVSHSKLSKPKKRRLEEVLPTCGGTSELKKKKLDLENHQSAPEDAKTKKFKWNKIIVKVLEAAENNELSVKRLRKKVISEYSSTGKEVDNSVFAKFTKKLAKNPVVVVLKDRAQLKK